MGTANCVGLSSGLDALRLSLIASGLAPGDGVVVPAATFAATFEAVVQAGATPVVVDVAEGDYGLDVAQTEAAVADGASLMIPVHLYGQMSDMKALSRIAEREGTQIIEDACQAHGASRDGVRAGQAGRAAAFSFYPSKNLGAMGDAGALVTDDEELASRVRALRVHGERSAWLRDCVLHARYADRTASLVVLF